MKSIVEIKKLTKSYGANKAIDNLTFSINKGEVVGLLGPNGAGKSTTMKIMTGYMSPSSGQVCICGFDVFENPIEVKKRIGFLPENPPLYYDMSIEKYLIYVAKLKKVSSDHIPAFVKLALEQTHLLEVKNRRIKNLSKGFKQRVGIAQALVSQPEVLILDEPTVGLDPQQVIEIRSLINSLKGKYTIILSTHILSEVQATCDKIIIIHKGRLVVEDNIDHIIHRVSMAQQGDQSATTIQLRIENPIDLISDFLKIQNINKVESKDFKLYNIDLKNSVETSTQILNLIILKKALLVEYKINENNLENIFLSLTYNNDGDKIQ